MFILNRFFVYIWAHLIPVIFVISAVFVTVSLAGILPESLLDQLVKISTVVGALAVVVAVRQLYAEHERGRREKTVEYLWNWSTNLSPELPRVRKFVEGLSKEDCQKLKHCQSFKVHKDLVGELEYLREYMSLFNHNELKNTDQDYHDKPLSRKKKKVNRRVSAREATIIRGLAVKYLNQLETLLVGWQYAVLSKDIIEHQFSYLFEEKDANYGLKDFRKVLGGQGTYPAIESFEVVMQEKKHRELVNKANIM